MVIDDLKRNYRSKPHWDQQQKGLEAMASYLSYARNPAVSKKALSIEDLLAKVRYTFGGQAVELKACQGLY